MTTENATVSQNMSTENTTVPQTMDDSSTNVKMTPDLECQIISIENQISRRNTEIDELKKKLDEEKTKIKDLKYQNKKSESKVDIDTSNNELWRKMIGIKRKQIKQCNEKLKNLKELGTLKKKKKTDRVKITDLKDSIEMWKKKVDEEKAKGKAVVDLKNEEIERLNAKIAQLKETNKIANWECKFLCTELGKAKGQPVSVLDVELQNFINRHTQVGTTRSIQFH